MAIRKSEYSSLYSIQCLKELLRKFYFFGDKDGSNVLIEEFSINNIEDALTKANWTSRTRYSLRKTNIVFNVSASQMNANPGILNNKLKVIVSLNYEHDKSATDIKNILPSYCLELEISGTRKDDKKNRVKFAWHLDREENVEGHYTHPVFHFHAGSNKLGSLSTGKLLLIGSPRVAHPPMDIFLAINFVIHNFFHSKDFANQRKILYSEEYQLLIKKSKDTFLKPYFNSIMENIDRDVNPYFPI